MTAQFHAGTELGHCVVKLDKMHASTWLANQVTHVVLKTTPIDFCMMSLHSSATLDTSYCAE